MYPWSKPAASETIDCSYANFTFGGNYCDPIHPNAVGFESSIGDGLWGQTDLAGNVRDWVLDWSASYVNPCSDCANLSTASKRVGRGGDFAQPEQLLKNGIRHAEVPGYRNSLWGMRCARTP